MLESLKIQNFRKLEDFKVGRLGRLNLIIGKNNTGKSSILEALYIYANRGDLSVLETIIKQRDEIAQEVEKDNVLLMIKNFLALFTGRSYDYLKQKSILIGELNNTEHVYEIRPISYTTEINENIAAQKFEGKSSINLNEIIETFVNVTSNKENSNDTKIGFQIKIGNEKPVIKSVDGLLDFFNLFSKAERKEIPCEYVTSSGISNEKAAELWDNISLTDDEERVNKLLKTIDTNINKITFKGKYNKSPFIRMKDIKDPIPVKSLGEGTNKLLNLAIALYNCKNGILLIDEFENGFYYKLQDEIWDKIFLIAEKLKIQVFATTHSLDTIYSFINSMENHRDISASVFRMAEINNEIEAIEYDFDELVLTKNQRTELR